MAARVVNRQLRTAVTSPRACKDRTLDAKVPPPSLQYAHTRHVVGRYLRLRVSRANSGTSHKSSGGECPLASVIHKAELSKMVAERLGISQTAAGDATSANLDSIGQALSENERVALTGFGAFAVREGQRGDACDSGGQCGSDDRCACSEICCFQGWKHTRTDCTRRSSITD